jgi:hypothetical protein
MGNMNLGNLISATAGLLGLRRRTNSAGAGNRGGHHPRYICTGQSERENAQRHGCNSESERRSRRVADINNGQNKGQAKGERTQGRGKGNIGGVLTDKPHGECKDWHPTGRSAQTARDSRVAPQMRGRHKNGQSGRGNTGNSNPREE